MVHLYFLLPNFFFYNCAALSNNRPGRPLCRPSSIGLCPSMHHHLFFLLHISLYYIPPPQFLVSLFFSSFFLSLASHMPSLHHSLILFSLHPLAINRSLSLFLVAAFYHTSTCHFSPLSPCFPNSCSHSFTTPSLFLNHCT